MDFGASLGSYGEAQSGIGTSRSATGDHMEVVYTAHLAVTAKVAFLAIRFS
jgi:hypothetical protein